jgi:hypothetical protein
MSQADADQGDVSARDESGRFVNMNKELRASISDGSLGGFVPTERDLRPDANEQIRRAIDQAELRRGDDGSDRGSSS